MKLVLLKRFCFICFASLCFGAFGIGLLAVSPMLFDRKPPYTITDIEIGSGAAGEMVPFSATIVPATPGRRCWATVNAQSVGPKSAPLIGLVSQSRLISGLSIHEQLLRTGDKFLTSLQVPVNMSPGDGRMIVRVDMGCNDNIFHHSFPIVIESAVNWQFKDKANGVN